MQEINIYQGNQLINQLTVQPLEKNNNQNVAINESVIKCKSAVSAINGKYAVISLKKNIANFVNQLIDQILINQSIRQMGGNQWIC